MLSCNGYHPLVRRRRGFTVVELLVVIGIIVILAGILLPSLRHARIEARITHCISNLRQMGVALTLYANQYGEGRVDAYPPWLTLLLRTGGKRKFLEDPKAFICKEDPSQGLEGGRPDGMRYEGQSEPIAQFEMADIDDEDYKIGPNGKPYLDGSSTKKNEKNGGINCSYIFEYNGEPCDWIYPSGPPVTPASVGGVPDGYEWQWSTKPNWATFKQLADTDENGVLSWNEVKILSRKGNSDYGLPAWGDRVPIVRCYWHVENFGPLRDGSLVLDLLGDANAVERGVPPWYK